MQIDVRVANIRYYGHYRVSGPLLSSSAAAAAKHHAPQHSNGTRTGRWQQQRQRQRWAVVHSEGFWVHEVRTTNKWYSPALRE